MFNIIKLPLVVLAIGLVCKLSYEAGMRAGYVVSCSNELLQMLVTVLGKGNF